MVNGPLYHRSAVEPSQPQKKQEKDLKNQKEREKKEKDAIKKFKVSNICIFSTYYTTTSHCGLLYWFMVIIKDCLPGLFFPQITTPLQVIHQVKAKADCKGGKHDLSIKKGESVDIIRITDNPEGKWLGRSQDGSCKSSHSYIYIFDVNWSLIP